MRPPVPHFLYRCYDADGLLLYIGCTSHIPTRMTRHKFDRRSKASRWLQVSMARYEVSERYPTRAAGLSAEAHAIQTEQPLFNRKSRGVPASETVPRIGEYLISRGHFELAVETDCLALARAA